MRIHILIVAALRHTHDPRFAPPNSLPTVHVSAILFNFRKVFFPLHWRRWRCRYSDAVQRMSHYIYVSFLPWMRPISNLWYHFESWTSKLYDWVYVSMLMLNSIIHFKIENCIYMTSSRNGNVDILLTQCYPCESPKKNSIYFCQFITNCQTICSRSKLPHMFDNSQATWVAFEFHRH